jgi:hypothetical protein
MLSVVCSARVAIRLEVYELSSFSYASFALANSCLYASSSYFKNSFSCKTDAIVALGCWEGAAGMVVVACVSASW